MAVSLCKDEETKLGLINFETLLEVACSHYIRNKTQGCAGYAKAPKCYFGSKLTTSFSIH